MSEHASNLVDIAVEFRHETTKAILVHDGAKEVWLPKSQVEYEHSGKGGVIVTMPEWLAKDKRLI
jgi:hypothetical protein